MNFYPCIVAIFLMALGVPSDASNSWQLPGQEISSHDDAPLAPPFRHMQFPRVLQKKGAMVRTFSEPMGANDVLSVIATQTTVKSQFDRNTCTMFSTLGLLESLLIKKGMANKDVRLSVEWLQYLIARDREVDGSESSANFQALIKYGVPYENFMEYDGSFWKDLTRDPEKKYCGFILGLFSQQACLIGHRDPSMLDLDDQKVAAAPFNDPAFAVARKQAAKNRDKYFYDNGVLTAVGEVPQTDVAIKKILDTGIPVLVDLQVYYGTWSHRKGPGIGIPRNLEYWKSGMVTYPEEGSLDLQNSSKLPAGHSVVIVGYDDNVELTYDIPMVGGSTKTFTRRGVYYFKNSWASRGFATEFTLKGKAFPGYGVMTQDYAHKYGSFFSIRLAGQ